VFDAIPCVTTTAPWGDGRQEVMTNLTAVKEQAERVFAAREGRAAPYSQDEYDAMQRSALLGSFSD
jgi:hypothetical protein